MPLSSSSCSCHDAPSSWLTQSVIFVRRTSDFGPENTSGATVPGLGLRAAINVADESARPGGAVVLVGALLLRDGRPGLLAPARQHGLLHEARQQHGALPAGTR